MLESESNQKPLLHPALSILLLLFLALVGMFAGTLVGIQLYQLFSTSDLDLVDAITDLENPAARPLLLAAQGGASLFGMIIAPLLFFRTLRLRLGSALGTLNIPLFIFLVAALIVVFSFGVNSLFLQWNQDLVFPEFLKGFEEWARAREDEAARLTEGLTKMAGPADLFFALVVIAILPGIGEELVFRGVVQNELFRGTKNIHVAIWLSAILFSAFHLQFFGFLPRMMLGALFGYLYYWSGSLWVAMAAHVVNNGAQIVALYYYQQGNFDFDLDKPDIIPANVVVMSALLTGGLLYYFFKYFRQRRSTNTA